MNIKELSLRSLVAALVLTSACVVDDDPGQDTDTETNPTTMTASDPTMGTMTDPTVGTGTTNSTDPDTTATDTDPSTDTDPDTDTDTDTDTGPDPDNYDIREDDPSAYAQVERMGFPGVNTALIASANKDAYNLASPEDDTNGDFAGDVVASINYIHDGAGDGNGLEDDVEGALTALLGTTTPEDFMCQQPSTGDINDTCVSQGGPFIFPDVLVVDTTAASGFPLNGRELESPVIDIVLAVLLLDVLDENKAPTPITLNALADLDVAAEGSQGLSQSGNDMDFPGAFPYLAPAHE